MKQVFNLGDKVIKRGTNAPIMTIVVQTMQAGFPQYNIVEDTYTCSVTDGGNITRIELHESELKRYYDDPILREIDFCRDSLLNKEEDASTNQLSLIQNRRSVLIEFEKLYAARDKSPILQEQIRKEFMKGILDIKNQILNI